MKELNIKLSVQEVNMVIKALGQFPYSQVHEVIEKVHVQAEQQVNKENGKTTEDQKETLETNAN